MGLNLVWVCHKHRIFEVSMRGEEGVDFQAIARGEHAECLMSGEITVNGDQWFARDAFLDMGYTEDFWAYEARPAVQQARRQLEALIGPGPGPE